jgi:PhoPQ-activated pathogenicity-related protein
MNSPFQSPAVRRSASAFFIGSLLAGSLSLPVLAKDALADYLTRPDDSFAWKQVNKRTTNGLTAVRLDITSQTWRDSAWSHQMLVVKPETVRNKDIGFLFITGDGDVGKQIELLKTLAQRGGAIAAIINRVPNQPLYGDKKEDALIAYTFEQYLKTGDATWPLLFPMVKSAVRGMDAVQALARQEWGQNIERFVVAGASKRGWTTWLTAAADSRVKAIAPMVIDMLNMKVQKEWTEKMYGRQSEQIKDYTERGLTEQMDSPRMVELRGWVDPYSYRARYTLPKLLLLGTNDPYWVVDSLRNYWNDLPDPKLVYQTPNAGHDLGGGKEATKTLAAFFQMIADHQSLPTMTWHFSTNSAGAATVDADVEPKAASIRLWTATSPDRDFRERAWSSNELLLDGGHRATAVVNGEGAAYRAYLLEAELKSPTGETYKLSSEARVTPDGPPAERRAAPGGQ